MSSSYTSNLRLVLPVQGELSGTWGDTVNTGLTSLTDSAIAGYVTVSVTSANQALTYANGSADESRMAFIKLTTTTVASFSVYAPPASKSYVIYNSTAYSATIYNSTVIGNTTAAGTGVTVPAGKTVTVYTNGTNFVPTLDYIPTLSLGGTANSVLYLNASGVVSNTTGFTWDGSTLAVPGTITNTSNYIQTSTEANVTLTTTGQRSYSLISGGGGNATVTYFVIRNNTAGTNPFFVAPDAVSNTLGLTSTGVSVTGALSATGNVNAGNASAAAQVNVLANNTGTAGGGSINVSNAGTTVAALGNYSNIVGGTYDATTTLYAGSTGLRTYISGLGVATTLDTSGNLGLGVTPSAWQSALRAVDIVSGGAALVGGTGVAVLSSNSYYNGTNWFYKTTGYAQHFDMDASGRFTWNTAASGTAGAVVSFTQPMVLDASGNLGLAAAPSAWVSTAKALQINSFTSLSQQSNGSANLLHNAYEYSANAFKYVTTSAASYYSSYNGSHAWYTAPSGTAGNTITFTQAMTLDSTGLAVTGALSATGQISTGATANAIIATGASTAAKYLNVGNTSGNFYAGVESSTGGSILTGSAAYSGSIGSLNGLNLSGDGSNAHVKLDTSGNLGLGVTPSASNASNSLVLKNNASLYFAGPVAYYDSNCVYNSGEKYVITGAAARYRQIDGAHDWYTAPSGTAGTAITFTRAMTLDASGNLGLGVTPSAWNGSVIATEVPGGFYGSNAGTGLYWGHNTYYNGSNWIYKSTAGAAYQGVVGGQFAWFNAPSGTAGTAITFTQAMTLDASGRLGIGTTPGTDQNLMVNMTGSSGVSQYGWFTQSPSSVSIGAYASGISLQWGNVANGIYSVHGGDLNNSGMAFVVGGSGASTERMRLDLAGNLLIGATSALNSGKLTIAQASGVARISVQSTVAAANDASLYLEAAGTNAGEIYYQRSTSQLQLKNGSVVGLIQDTVGNLGIGVTPSGWNGGVRSIEIGGAGYGVASNGGATYINNNSNYSTGWRLTNATAAGQYAIIGGQHIWYYAPTGTAGNLVNGTGSFTQQMILDGTGNLGIGTNPSAWGASRIGIDLPALAHIVSQGNSIEIGTNHYFNGTNYIYKGSNYATLQTQNSSGAHAWYIAPSGTAGNAITFTQAMTLDASGNLLLGVSTFGNGNATNVQIQPAAGVVLQQHISGTASGAVYSQFNYNGAAIGSITQNGTTAVAYNLTSDHRLKTNVRPADALKFMDIQFRDFEWVDGRHDCGVIAHELQAVYPDLVLGEKDAVDENGKPVYQQVNYTGLICRMGTTIQKQQRLIEAMEARLAALESR